MKVFLTMADTETRFRKLYSVEKIPKLTLQIHESAFFLRNGKIFGGFFNCDRENGCRNPPHRA